MSDTVHTLHPIEVKMLRAFEGTRSLTDQAIVVSGALNEAQLRTAIEWQKAKGGITVPEEEETVTATVEVTEAGKEVLERGIPELVLAGFFEEEGPFRPNRLSEAPGLSKQEAGIAFGNLKKQGAVHQVDKGLFALAPGADLSPFQHLKKGLETVAGKRIDVTDLPERLQDVIEEHSRKRGASRGLFRISEARTRQLHLTDQGVAWRDRIFEEGLTGEEESQLTQEMLLDGSWKEKRFRRYNIELSPPRQIVGKRHPYREFLDHVKQRLIGLGFQELVGPLVESEYWNMDALFMPQFHPARDIHDVYFVKDPTHATEIPEPQLSNVARAHTDGGDTGSLGWGYDFDRERTRRLVLRSQGTALSSRALRDAEIPGKYFAMARCFRYDVVDSTHLSDFFQVEGIVLDEETTFVELLGLLRLFAEEIAEADDVRYVPAYFPFTEPSVEVHMYDAAHDRWMELGGAGIFRPEVAKPQGVDVPVLAWGLGLDRMAMVALGVSDIRDLFAAPAARPGWSLDQLRRQRMPLRD